MTMWKAQVTERNTFLEITFDDEEAFYGAPCLRRNSSEPQLNTAYYGAQGMSNSLIMLDQFSGYVDNARREEAKTDAQEVASELSDLASTTSPLDESVSESESQGSSHKKMDKSQDGKGFSPEVRVTDDDQIYFPADCGEMWQSELSVGRHHTGEIWKSEISESSIGKYHSSEIWESESSVGRRKPRPCKGQRERYRKTVMRLMNEVEQNPDFNINDAYLPPSLANDTWRRQNLEAKLLAHQERVQRERDTDALLRPLIQREYHGAHSVTLEEVFARGQAALPLQY